MSDPLTASGPAQAVPEVVWSVLADIASWPAWLPTVTAAQALEPARPTGVGAAYRIEQPRLRPAVWTVTRWEPGIGFTWESAAPGVRTIADHRLTPRPGGGTDIELSIAWTGPLARLVRRGYGALTQGYLRTEVGALAERAQARVA